MSFQMNFRHLRTFVAIAEAGGIARAGGLLWSNLKLDPYFHDLRARNFEICTRPLGIVMHEGE